jgi:phage terminase large subunit GpA-like protein
MSQTANAQRIALESIACALEPPAPIDFLAWAENNIVFEDGPFRGPYSRALFPFNDEILRALSPDDPCRFVTFMASAQCGKTVLGNIFCLGSLVMGRGTFLYCHPTTDNALRWSKAKLTPLMNSTAGVRELFPQRANDSTAAILYKERRDGLARLLISGANSPASLSQVTISNQVQDDLAKWEPNLAGNPESMADSRSRAIADAKILKISTPLLSPGCNITKNFTDGSQEYPYVPCPHCGHHQILEWSNFLAALDPTKPDEAHFTCIECGCLILEHDRPKMLASFQWRSHNPSAKATHRSFWLWSAYSYLQSWEQIAREWLKNQGDPAGEKSFWNDTLGIAYETRGDGRPWEELAARAAKSDYARGVVPKGALVLTLGVDCQLDRIEWVLVGHGQQYRRYIVDYGVIGKHISEPDCQRNLDLLLERKLFNYCGQPMGISLTAIDANYSTDEVLNYARKYPTHKLIAIRGARGDSAPRIAKVQRERDEKKGVVRKRGNRFFNIGVNNFKLALYRDLAKDDPALPGYISFPTGLEDRFFQELVSETRVAKKRMGQLYYVWDKPDRQANEMLDAVIYASAAAIKHGVNAISDTGWKKLESEFEVRAPLAADATKLDNPRALVFKSLASQLAR